MSVTQIDNFTVTQADYQGIVGNTLYGATGGTGVVELVLSPNQGYTVTATDFSWDGTPSNGVTAVNFVQDGTDVKCNLTIDPTYIIPSGGISFPVCVSGKSVLIPINLTLNFSNVLTNATSNVSNGALTFSGDRGTTTPVLDVTLTADANNKFPTPINDSAFFTITNTNPQSSVSSNDFTVNKTYGQDGSGNFNSMRVVASYTFPTTDETFNFSVTGSAEAIPVITPLVINSISGNFSSVNWKGTARGFTLLGTPGATFNYSLTATGETAQSGSGTINSSGYYSIPALQFAQRAAANSRNFALTITATSTATSTTTLNPTAFGGQTSTYGFTIVQTAQDTVFITRNVRVDGASSGDANDSLAIGWIENASVRTEARPMSNTFSSQGIVITISDVFEVPINYNILTKIKYTQHSISSPGAYYTQVNITGMSAGNGVTNGTAANSSGATSLIQPSCTSPGAGAATAGVVNLTASVNAIP
jgi:hypothetical protein